MCTRIFVCTVLCHKNVNREQGGDDDDSGNHYDGGDHNGGDDDGDATRMLMAVRTMMATTMLLAAKMMMVRTTTMLATTIVAKIVSTARRGSPASTLAKCRSSSMMYLVGDRATSHHICFSVAVPSRSLQTCNCRLRTLVSSFVQRGTSPLFFSFVVQET